MRPLLLVCGMLVIAWPVGRAQAQRRHHQSSPPQDPAELARAHFFTGVSLYEEGNYDGALAEFDESDRIRPVAVVTFNIAQTLRAMHRYTEAIVAFRRYLTQLGDRASPAQKGLVHQTVRDLRRRIAPITLVIAPAGTHVRVDGREVGTAPLPGPLWLGAGRRVLELDADGYLPLREELVVVGRKRRTLHIGLARRETAGTIRVTTAPPHAEVRIDGLEVGRAPVERRLPGGGHVVEAVAPHYDLYRASIGLADRQILPLHAVLERNTGPPLYAHWWFWTAVAVGVASVAVLAVALAPPSENSPVPGNVDPSVVTALRMGD